MVIRDFSPQDVPAAIDVHNRQHIAWPVRPSTSAAWAEVERARDPNYKHRRWVAVLDHQVVGVGAYEQFTGEYHPQRFHVDVEVLPAYQWQGIGSALFQRVTEAVQAFAPRVLRADAFSHLPQGFRFLQHRGFYEAFRETPVHLEVAGFDPARYAGLEGWLEHQGILLKTLRQLATDPDRDRKLYALYCTVDADVPREAQEYEPPSFAEWQAWGLNDPTNLPDAYLVAVCGEEYVGLRDVSGCGSALLGGLMGVRQAFRKCGIAMAMMVRNIIYAQEHGYRRIKDCTWVHNFPMQALFTRLGFARSPEWQQCQKDLGG